MAIDRYLAIAAAPGGAAAPGPAARVFSADLGESADVRVRGEITPGAGGWSAYVQGVVAGFVERGAEPAPFDAAIRSGPGLQKEGITNHLPPAPPAQSPSTSPLVNRVAGVEQHRHALQPRRLPRHDAPGRRRSAGDLRRQGLRLGRGPGGDDHGAAPGRPDEHLRLPAEDERPLLHPDLRGRPGGDAQQAHPRGLSS